MSRVDSIARARPGLHRMSRLSLLSRIIPLCLCSGIALSEPHQRRDAPFDIQRVAEGVFVARAHSESLAGANATFIINEEDILVVDTHMTPGSAAALLDAIGDYSPLPVRFVVQTHWHPDHTQGTQVFWRAFPGDATVISHQTAREEMATLGVARLNRDLEGLPSEIDSLRQKLRDDPNTPDSVDLRAALSHKERLLTELRSVQLVLPKVTFANALTLSRGQRIIRLLYFGRGHTAGDAVVHLPAERIAVVGDLVTGGPPFARDGFPEEWIETLKALESLDVGTVVSGHGAVMGPEVFAHRRAFLESALEVVRAGRQSGLSDSDIAGQIDIDSFRRGFDPEPADRPWRGWMRMIVDRALLDDEDEPR